MAHPATPLVAIVGATGTGKSELAIELATRLRDLGRAAEVVGADAMQLYRGMDVGTAKLPVAERAGIPHHLIDELDVVDEASVAWYQPRARAAVEGILARGAVPILVGGSGLYVSGVIYDFRFPARDPEVRARLEAEAQRVGAAGLHRRLIELDPVTAANIDASNPRRLVRALEIAELAERGHGATLPARPTLWRPTLVHGIAVERSALVERLDARVRRMWREGIVAEVERLLPLGFDSGTTASRAIGYAQARAQLAGALDEPAAIEATAALTRRYARRQVSWFKRYEGVRWHQATGDPAERGRFADEVMARLEQ